MDNKNKGNNANKSAVFFMISSFLTLGINFITTPIFTRILSQEDYGLTNVYSSWYSIISVVATLSLSAGVFNVGLLNYKNDRDGYTSSMIGLSNFATILIFLLFLLFSNFVFSFIKLPKSLIILMFTQLMIQPATSFWLARNRYEYKYKAAFITTLISTILSVSFSVLIVYMADNNKAIYKLWTMALVPLSISLYLYITSLVKGKKVYNKKYWKFALTFNLPLLLHYLSFSILSGSDRIMISNFQGEAAAGIYGLVYTIGTVGTVLWNSINGSLIPYTHQKMEEKKYDDINKTSIQLLLVYGVMVMLMMLFAPEALKILAPKSYYEGVFIFPPVMSGLFFTAVYNVFANIEFYYKKTVPIMFASIFSSVINVVLNYIFIPKFGYIAAAYTTLVSYALLVVFHYINLKRVQEENIFNIKYIILISSSVIGFNFLVTILYLNTLLRYIFIFITILVLFISHKRLINLYYKLVNKKKV